MKSRISSRRPAEDECTLDYHRQLISQVSGECVLEVLEAQMTWLCECASSLSTDQVDRIHPPYTWTIRQVFEHCGDAERVFGYRMLRFAAGDTTDLSSWDENAYAASRFGLGNFRGLVEEIAALRQSNVLLLRRIVPSAWDRRGTVDGNALTVRTLAWLAAGHLQHHLRIVEMRVNPTLA